MRSQPSILDSLVDLPLAPEYLPLILSVMPITLRRPTDADAPDLGRIVYTAFCGIADAHRFPHDFPSQDVVSQFIPMFLSHPRIYPVAAEVGGTLVGSNFLDERDAIRSVGPITVDPASQAKGVGRRLMEAVIERGRGAAGIRLVQDAFNRTSLSLYTALGFDLKEPLALMRGRPRSVVSADVEIRPMEPTDLPACAALCQKVHGFDRNNELTDTRPMFGSYVLTRSGKIKAYMAAPTFWILNHSVAETEQDLKDLILGVASAVTEPLSFLLPMRQSDLFRWCLAEGLKIVKPMNLMAMGEFYEPKGAYLTSVGY
jgi:GNAT superfamily N-acetyltransferase